MPGIDKRDKNKPNEVLGKERDYESLIKTARKIFTGGIVLFVGYLQASEFFKAFEAGNVTLVISFPIILILITLILGFLWLASAEHEIAILKKYLSEYIPERTFSPVLFSYVIPIFIIILAALVSKIFFYSILYWLYLTFDVFGRAYTTKLLIDGIRLSQLDGSKQSEALNEIKSYYNRPFEVRGYLTGTIIISAFFCSLLSKFGLVASETRNMFQAAAYMLVILSIIGGEISIWIWRYKFYGKMKQFDKVSKCISSNKANSADAKNNAADWRRSSKVQGVNQ